MAESPANRDCITWTEIPVKDLARAKEFYSVVFGWDFPTFGPPPTDPPHMAIFNHGPGSGSLVQVEPENHLSPALHSDNPEKKRMSVRVTLGVDNVDEKLTKVEANGGKLYKPKVEIPGNMGFVAYFTDTEGNVMGLWSQK